MIETLTVLPRSCSRAFRRLLLIVVACTLLSAACSTSTEVSMRGDGDSTTTATQPQTGAASPTPGAEAGEGGGGGEPTDPEPTPTTVVTPAPVAPTVEPVDPEPTPTGPPGLDDTFSHDDLVQAREALDAARARWNNSEIDDYVLRAAASCECDGWSIESLVLRGESRWFGARDHREADRDVVPLTMNDAFDRAERLLRALEDDPSLRPVGECDGRPLQMSFDAVTGALRTVSDNGPCDGGVGWTLTIRSLTEEGDATAGIADGTRIDRDQLAGLELADGIPGIVIVERIDDRALIAVDPDEGGSGIQPNWIVVGEPCRDAIDKNRCWDLVATAAADAPAQLVVPCEMCAWTDYAVIRGTTSGAPVAVDDRLSLLEVLGPIDTPAEVAFAAGRLGSVTATDAGWTISFGAIVLGCDPVVDRFATSTVTTQGAVTEVDATYRVAWGVCI